MITLNLQLPKDSYSIYINRGILNDISYLLPYVYNRQVAIITNETVAPLYFGPLKKELEKEDIHVIPVVLRDGEQYKNWDSLNEIFNQLLSNHAERNTTLIALGGGVIGDMTGFAAACYQRGAPYIQMPTTLLAQVDSAVGGKTAINHLLGKNMIGAFYQPKVVLADTAVLTTLPERELSAGLSEVIKYAVLGDEVFLSWLEENIHLLRQLDDSALSEVIAHCCRMKADLVLQDEKEHGVRALLNLGHTFGHAIEVRMGYGHWLHGEAVAAGMVLAAGVSEKLGWLNFSDVERLQKLLNLAGLPSRAPDFGLDVWMDSMMHDKKVEQGRIRFVLLSALGRAIISDEVTNSVMSAVLSDVRYIDSEIRI